VIQGKGDQVTIARAVVEHTLKRIRDTPMRSTPYEHIYIEQIFEPQFYKCILAQLPPGDGAGGLSKLNRNRFTVPLNRQKSPGISLEKAVAAGVNRQFWNAFAAAFATPEMSVLWVSRFNRTTGARFKNGGLAPPWSAGAGGAPGPAPQPSYTYEMDLSRDVTGYAILPHTDSSGKMVTTLYYLPRTADPKVAQAGTCVVRSLTGEVTKSGSGRHGWEDMEVAFQAKFVPNSMMAFAPCTSSWHAVKKTAGKVTRNTIQGFVHINDKTPRKAACYNSGSAQ